MAMASGEQLKNAKIAVLDLINKNKEVLFGKLSDALTRESKEAKWAEVADHAHVLGAFPWHRTWDYLRDTTWQNWRKRFVEKRDKKDKFDATGTGTRVIYDEADLLIMEILEALGKSFPSMMQLSSLNSSSSLISSVASGEPTISDIHDILEIEMNLKQEEQEGSEDVTDGAHHHHYHQPGGENGNHNQALVLLDEEGNDDANNFIQEDGESSQDIYEEEDQHPRYRTNNYISNPTTNNAEGGNGGGGGGGGRPLLNSSSQPKIVSTSSLAPSSSARAASLLRKSAFAAVRSNAAVRKRPASSSISALMMSSTSSEEKSAEKELAALKCRKIRAELDLLHRETYKRDLEIFQLERALGLPASDLTRKFYRSSVRNNNHQSILNNNLSNR